MHRPTTDRSLVLFISLSCALYACSDNAAAPDMTIPNDGGYGLLQRLPNTHCLLGAALSTPPTKLSETGCFSSLADGFSQPQPELIPYDLNSPLWSDGLSKRRYFLVPDNQTIGFSATGAWDFPDGSILIKEFILEKKQGDPASRETIETRFLIRENSVWKGYSYEWTGPNEAQLLDPPPKTKTFDVETTGGGMATFEHLYPGRSQCIGCHTNPSGNVLGPRTGQLNRDYDYGGVVDNQLRAMDHIGLLNPSPGPAAQLPAWSDPADTAAPLEQRARAYMAANCAHCHLPGGPTPVDMDLRFETPFAQTGTCNVNALIPSEVLIKPGDSAGSFLVERISMRPGMPPVATNAVDDVAVAAIGGWIDSLNGCGSSPDGGVADGGSSDAGVDAGNDASSAADAAVD